MQFNNFLHNQEVQSIQLADCVISPSRYISDFLDAHFQTKKVVTIPFGVNPRKNMTLQESNDKADKRVIFGFIGNISPRKGCHILLSAWSKLEKNVKHHLFCRVRFTSVIKINEPKDITYYEFGDAEKF